MAIFFIKKIFEKEDGNTVHRQFVRFSKGVFFNKAVMNFNKSERIKISGTYDALTDMVYFISTLVPKIKISGVIISRNAIPGMSGKEKKGAFNYLVDEEIESKKLAEIAENSLYCLLDCSAPGIEMKTKKTLPRPSNKGEGKVNDKFFTAAVDIKFWPHIKNEFLFNLPEGKKFKIAHKYEITSVIIPKGEKDFEKMRLLAKKKGKLTRNSEIDGKTVLSEIEFEA